MNKKISLKVIEHLILEVLKINKGECAEIQIKNYILRKNSIKNEYFANDIYQKEINRDVIEAINNLIDRRLIRTSGRYFFSFTEHYLENEERKKKSRSMKVKRESIDNLTSQSKFIQNIKPIEDKISVNKTKIKETLNNYENLINIKVTLSVKFDIKEHTPQNVTKILNEINKLSSFLEYIVPSKIELKEIKFGCIILDISMSIVQSIISGIAIDATKSAFFIDNEEITKEKLYEDIKNKSEQERREIEEFYDRQLKRAKELNNLDKRGLVLDEELVNKKAERENIILIGENLKKDLEIKNLELLRQYAKINDIDLPTADEIQNIKSLLPVIKDSQIKVEHDIKELNIYIPALDAYKGNM